MISGIRKLIQVSLATSTSYVMSFLFLLVAGRTLSGPEFINFSKFWGIFFFIGSILGALEIETTRQYANAFKNNEIIENSTETLRKILIAGAKLYVLILLFVYLYQIIFSEFNFQILVWITFGSLFFIPLTIVRGYFLSSSRLDDYRNLVIGEGIVRLILITISINLYSESAPAFFAVSALGMLVALPFVKQINKSIENFDFKLQMKYFYWVAIGNAGIAGFIALTPFLVATYVQSSISTINGMVAALPLVRAPILILSLVQPLLIPFFINKSSEVTHRLKSRLAMVTVAVLLVLVVSYNFGDKLVKLFFGEDFEISNTIFVSLVAVSVLIGIGLVQNAILISLNLHKEFALIWIIGLIIQLISVSIISPSPEVFSIILAVTSIFIIFWSGSVIRKNKLKINQ